MDKFDIEKFPASTSAKNMLHSISEDFYQNSYVMKWLLQVMGIEWDCAKKIIEEELPQQFFVETATWGLIFHEQKWQLPVRENLNYEERRRLIYQRRDFKAPMTPFKMENYLKEVTGFEVHISDCHDAGEYGVLPDHPNCFKVFFIGDETLDVKTAKMMINRLKQSHTTYMLNDRKEIVFDERELEHLRLANISFKMAIPYWGGLILDGKWYLDGTHDLSAGRRYGLRFGFLTGITGVTTRQEAELKNIRFLMKNKINESLNIGVRYSFGVSFWKAYCLDGSWKLDGRKLLNSVYGDDRLSINFHATADSSGIEEIADMTITTKTRDYWFLNGAFPLDGTKKLNAIYRKEEVEQ